MTARDGGRRRDNMFEAFVPSWQVFMEEKKSRTLTKFERNNLRSNLLMCTKPPADCFPITPRGNFNGRDATQRNQSASSKKLILATSGHKFQRNIRIGTTKPPWNSQFGFEKGSVHDTLIRGEFMAQLDPKPWKLEQQLNYTSTTSRYEAEQNQPIKISSATSSLNNIISKYEKFPVGLIPTSLQAASSDPHMLVRTSSYFQERKDPLPLPNTRPSTADYRQHQRPKSSYPNDKRPSTSQASPSKLVDRDPAKQRASTAKQSKRRSIAYSAFNMIADLQLHGNDEAKKEWRLLLAEAAARKEIDKEEGEKKKTTKRSSKPRLSLPNIDHQDLNDNVSRKKSHPFMTTVVHKLTGK